MLAKNSIKKIGMVAAVALILLISGNLTHAQTLNYHSYELLNLLEYLYPQFLSPVPQITKLDDGAFYRRYSDTGIEIRTKDNHLYIGSDDVGMIDDLFPFAQSEILFNWLETQFPEFLAPVPQATQVEGGIFYRAYPETNTMIGTFDEDLYFLDGQSQLYPLGRVDFWLGEILDFKEEMAGVYTIQQKSTMRYIDAYEHGSYPHDWELVTRGPQNDDTQKWIITPVGNNVYTIQQKSTMRYVDAYEHGSYPHDWELVTREPQNDDTQKWIFTLIPEDMKFLGIAYALDEAKITSVPETQVIATLDLPNDSDVAQSIDFRVNETIEEESYFERTVGFEVEIGRQVSVGIPYLTASANISISTSIDWTTGHAVTNSHSYTSTFTLTAPPHSVAHGSAVVWKATLSVPYVMFFESEKTGAIRVSKGTWSGVSTWGLRFVVTQE